MVELLQAIALGRANVQCLVLPSFESTEIRAHDIIDENMITHIAIGTANSRAALTGELRQKRGQWMPRAHRVEFSIDIGVAQNEMRQAILLGIIANIPFASNLANILRWQRARLNFLVHWLRGSSALERLRSV